MQALFKAALLPHLPPSTGAGAGGVGGGRGGVPPRGRRGRLAGSCARLRRGPGRLPAGGTLPAVCACRSHPRLLHACSRSPCSSARWRHAPSSCVCMLFEYQCLYASMHALFAACLLPMRSLLQFPVPAITCPIMLNATCCHRSAASCPEPTSQPSLMHFACPCAVRVSCKVAAQDRLTLQMSLFRD